MQFHRNLSCSGNYTYFNYINRVAGALGLDPEPEPIYRGEPWRKSREQSK